MGFWHVSKGGREERFVGTRGAIRQKERKDIVQGRWSGDGWDCECDGVWGWGLRVNVENAVDSVG